MDGLEMENPTRMDHLGIHPIWGYTQMVAVLPRWSFTFFSAAADLRLHVSPLMDLQHRWRLKATPPACESHTMATWEAEAPGNLGFHNGLRYCPEN